jgi:hypothetical protein
MHLTRPNARLALVGSCALALACGGLSEPTTWWGELTLVEDRRAGPAPEDHEFARFSPDLTRLVQARRESGAWRIYVGDEALTGTFTKMGGSGVVWSADSTRWGWFVQDAEGWHAVIDGAMGPAWPELRRGSLTFSPDARHVSYVATDAQAAAIVVLDGVARAPVPRASPVLYGGNAAVWLEGASDTELSVLVDGTPMFTGSEVRLLGVTPNGKPVWTTRDGDLYRLYVDGVAHPTAFTRAAAFATCGEAVATAVEADGGWWMLLGHDTFGPWADLGAPECGGEHVGWGARSGEGWHIYVDGTQKSLTPSHRLGAPSPVFGPEGRLAWWDSDPTGATRVWVDGVAWEATYEGMSEIPLRWSSDGAHVAAAVRSETGWGVVLDGVEVRAEDTLGSLAFGPDDDLLLWTSHDDDGWRVRAWRASDGSSYGSEPVGDLGLGLGAGILPIDDDTFQIPVVAEAATIRTFEFPRTIVTERRRNPRKPGGMHR